MITSLYVIYDAKAQMYNKPFSMQNDSVAMRACTDLANDPNTETCRHAEDFTLFKIGTYEDTNAEIQLDLTLTPLASFHELKMPTNVVPISQDAI